MIFDFFSNDYALLIKLDVSVIFGTDFFTLIFEML